jgi:hypothetical protein
VYHLTHVDNLSAIARFGLRSRRALLNDQRGFRDVADPKILTNRAEHGLDAYVPFHLITRSPFDYAVMHSHSDPRFVLIAVYRSFARAHGWKICPSHPLAGGQAPQLLDWDEGIGMIDWDTIDMPNRSYDDHHTKMVCMAEALSPTPVMVEDFVWVYAPNEEICRFAQGALGPKVTVQVNGGMFPSARR